jgi:hypothetical protein
MNYPGNCYSILQNIRYAINEHSTALVQGTDTTGAFQNSYLIDEINKAQYFIYSILFNTIPDLYLTSAPLTFSASVATLPTDCFKIREIDDSEGIPLTAIDMGQRHVGSYTGDKYAYYRYGNTVRVDRDSISETGTIWYYKRLREITSGMSSAGGALSLTLATTAKGIVDYYNNMTIENVTDNWVDTISDYTAARVCTLAAQTGAASKYYGIVSELPEIFHGVLEERAIIQVKQHPKAPFKITKLDLELNMENLRSAMISYAGTTTGDINIDNVINDFGDL